MILTCPECSTNYVVKDGAIPEGGRKVRCAACKHSWHQDQPGVQSPAPEEVDRSAATVVDHRSADANERSSLPDREDPWRDPSPAFEVDRPDQPSVEASDEAGSDLAETPPAEPEPASSEGYRPIETVSGDYSTTAFVPDQEIADVPTRTAGEHATIEEEEFQPFYPVIDDEEPSPRRWPIILFVIALIAAAAAAFWYLAPASVKQQVGLNQASSPLEVMDLGNSRQALASGNDLFTISGRIINPTAVSQPVPPLRAELLDESKTRVVHSWMISPPVASLGPNESRTFHSAEVGVPEGGEFIRVRLSTSG